MQITYKNKILKFVFVKYIYYLTNIKKKKNQIRKFFYFLKNYENKIMKKFLTYEVLVGNVKIGKSNPISVQSMTNTKTLDTKKSVEQIIKITKAGSDFVRLTVQNIKEAKNLKNIKNQLKKLNFNIPIVADVHFNPNIAEICAKNVEKVRINPGNYIDKKKFENLNYTELEYKNEIKKIRLRLLSLIKICKENKTSLRIGTNHGSLSDRIMSKYGNTILGMVESAMEFLRICKEENFYQVVISLKSSNTKIMVNSYRKMLEKMKEEKMNFPLHLGVTEAGESEDGRIKSAVGISSLLREGIGDTIRVSLSEAPELEIPVAKKILNYLENKKPVKKIIKNFHLEKRKLKIKNYPMVICDIFDYKIDEKFFSKFYDFNVKNNSWERKSLTPEFFFVNNLQINDKFKIPFFLRNFNENAEYNFLKIEHSHLKKSFFDKIKNFKNLIFILETYRNDVSETYASFEKLEFFKCEIPVIVKFSYKEKNFENLLLKASCDFGGLFIDSIADGIFIENKISNKNPEKINELSFGILQGTGARISKIEYISCPTCGRTSLNLQNLIKEIKENTKHLKGLKIGIMGCIVNGLGEMADADYGYIAIGKNKLNLYKKKILMKKNVPIEKASEELINLIAKTI
ncbi:MAG: 4-hydroxy-3-methylbut-2-en-1-yl diphosphate synthase [Bacteroidetes bacterium 4572_128]|nr:MAG: 4-hydroxy-3-methylbut-2-en-1-yl diphosphate synthase [Bacteroidetes bacterium 4572_128]